MTLTRNVTEVDDFINVLKLTDVIMQLYKNMLSIHPSHCYHLGVLRTELHMISDKLRPKEM